VIKAYIRPERAGKVIDGIRELGVGHATLANVKAIGYGTDPNDGKASMEFGCKVNHLARLEVICPDKLERQVVEKIMECARTGKPGDGIVTVQNLNRLVKIRNAAESLAAL
jgi:nitrogen regulatory protein PII